MWSTEIMSTHLLHLLFFMVADVFAGRDFYKILGLDSGASPEEIGKAYRKLAALEHPDRKPGDPVAKERFLELGEARDVLTDPDKREVYDQGGEEALDALKRQGGGGGNRWNPFPDFGFPFGFQENEEKRVERGADIVMELWVSLEELYQGNFVKLTHNKPVLKPARGTRKCNCRQELVTTQLGPGRFQMTQKQVCDDCPNVKFVNEEHLLEVEIEPGMVDGMEHKFVAEGEPHMDGEPGDLVVQIRTYPHKKFERRGDDLYTNVTVSLVDALSGFELDIEHLDGHRVRVSRERVTWPGARVRKRGEGMPSYEDNNNRGNMYVTLDVEFPKGELAEEDKLAISRILGQDPVNKVYNGLGGFR